ncbi:MAG TPA: hypothetical protein VFG76_03370, partial [Candidatus Polarisedimenticolia bacterium]|nr:hypothetical protein [Candidatus Polarisedimenticolia bacterium]
MRAKRIDDATRCSRYAIKAKLTYGLALLFTAVLSGSVPGKTLAHAGENDSIEKRLPAAKAMSLQVMKLQEELNHAAPGSRQAVLDELVATLQARKQILLELMEARTQSILEIALPDSARETLPRDMQGLVERHETLEGTLEIHVADNFDLKVVRTAYVLITDQGQEIALHFVRVPEGLQNNTRVQVKGVQIEREMALESASGGVLALSAETPTSTLLTMAYKKTAVVLFNFQNNPVEPYTLDAARATTFTSAASANDWYQEVSFGKIGLSGKVNVDGDVFGWYTIPYDNTTCTISTWVSAANAAAAASGFSSADYDKLIYAFPQTDSCDWWGLGGGNAAKINGSFALKVITHELGHTFGLPHANTYTCYDASGARVAIGTSCTSTEYGNVFDTMGIGTSGHFNNYFENWLGWFDPSAVQVANGDGVYTIAPMETATGGVQDLRIPRIVDPNGTVLRY